MPRFRPSHSRTRRSPAPSTSRWPLPRRRGSTSSSPTIPTPIAWPSRFRQCTADGDASPATRWATCSAGVPQSASRPRDRVAPSLPRSSARRRCVQSPTRSGSTSPRPSPVSSGSPVRRTSPTDTRRPSGTSSTRARSATRTASRQRSTFWHSWANSGHPVALSKITSMTSPPGSVRSRRRRSRSASPTCRRSHG